MQVPTINDFRQRANDVRFKLKIHCQIGMIPISKHPHANEVRFLGLYLLICIISTLFPELRRRDFVSGLTHFLFHIELNG